jgi:Tfp pilus assembly protein PilF
MDPDRAQAFNLLGGVFEARGNRPEAEKNYRVALALSPSYQPAQKNLDRVTSRPYTPLGIDWGLQAQEEQTRP